MVSTANNGFNVFKPNFDEDESEDGLKENEFGLGDFLPDQIQS